MFPFFINEAYANNTNAHEVIDLIVPAAQQIAVAITILVAAVVGAIAAVRSAMDSKKNVEISKTNSIQIAKIAAKVENTNEQIKASSPVSTDSQESLRSGKGIPENR